MPVDMFPNLIRQYDQLKFALLDAQTFDEQHFGFPEIYYEIMETDQQRVGAFQRAFAQCDIKDKVICEAGVGRLMLTQYYLPQVRKAYLIENNPKLFPYIERWLEERGLAQKVELFFADAREVQLPEPVDFIVGEMMSIFCANEFQVQVFKHLRQFLRPTGQLLPQRIINLVQLAHAEFPTEISHYPINFTRHLPELLSGQQVVNTIHLMTVEKERVEFSVTIRPMLSGVVNAVLLRSLVELLPGVNFTGTDSLMPPTVLQLANALEVQCDKPYVLEGAFVYGTSLDDAQFKITESPH